MIAIVDDDPLMCRATARLLQSAGYDVATYLSGSQFLSSLTTRRPRCIVLDLHMSPLSGFDVIETLAREGYNIATIVVTADCTPENVSRTRQAGAAACLPKPVEGDRLLEAIRKLNLRG